MICIKTVTLFEIRLPLKEPFLISSGAVTDRRILLLKLEDHDGQVAWSECVAGELPNYMPETIDTCWLAINNWIVPRVLNVAIQHPADVQALLDKNFRGHNMAKAAVEMGCWALAAQRLDQSLANYIGGTRRVIESGISLGIQRDTATLVEKVKDAFTQGYRKAKIKIKPGMDIEFLRAVREACGPDAPLMADANSAYTLEDVPHLKKFDALNLMMIEQPLAWDDVVAHAQLQKELTTPVCLDESITHLDRVREMVSLKSGRIVNIKPGRVGGFGASITMHDYCRDHGIPVWCGGMLESGVGRAYNVALASLENFSIPGDISPSRRYWEEDIVSPEWDMDTKGNVEVPGHRTGIGVDVREDLIENLTVRREKLE